MLATEPGAVAATALNKLGRRTTVVADWINWIMAFSTRLLPRSWNAAIFGRVIGGMLKGVNPSPRPRTEESAALL